MLSRIAKEFAAEISGHDWSDAHERLDRAGHDRASDHLKSSQIEPLTPAQAENIKTNVFWVTAQVLCHMDPNLDPYEFAEACGVPRRVTHTSRGDRNGGITAGLRMTAGLVDRPSVSS